VATETVITKQEALRRLAEWMHWKLKPGDWRHPMYVTPEGSYRVLDEYYGWWPFTKLEDAFELQPRLSEDQLGDFGRYIAEHNFPVSWERLAELTAATADQRTRAICRVALGVEVEA